MKKSIALLLGICMIGTILSGCTSKSTMDKKEDTKTEGETSAKSGDNETNSKIGYAIWSGASEDALAYGKSIEAAAEAAGLEAVYFDNKGNGEVTVNNVKNMAAQGIKYVVNGKPDTSTDAALAEIIKENDMKFISLDLPQTEGVFCGVDNTKACIPGGEALMNAAADQWNGEYDVFVKVWNPAEGEVVADRMDSFLAGAKNVADVPDNKIVDVDAEATSQAAMEKFSAYLTANAGLSKILVACENDGVAQGVIAAAENQNRIDDVLVVGAGCDSLAIGMLLQKAKGFVGSVNFGFFDVYGEVSVKLVQDWMESGEMPDETYVDTSFIDLSNLEKEVPTEEIARIKESLKL